ncbi:MAG TPA: LPS assembly protein LptD [Gammaproteobacteria bacterium]|nr:LPS assembly protein LptD [Gammaproteobacteria bacterium]
MKAGRAFILAAALLVSAPLHADPGNTTPAPASGTILTAIETAPSSSVPQAAILADAYGQRKGTCEANAPSSKPMLEPAARNQIPCTLTPSGRNPWGLCPAFPPSPVLPLPPGSPRASRQQAFVVGDHVESVQQGQSLISGDVQLDQGDHRVTGQNLLYDSNTGLATIKQSVNYYTPQLTVSSPEGRYDTNSGLGSFDDADFLLPKRHGHGSADLVNSLDSYHTQLFGVRYTTCPPDQVDWSLNAPNLSLDTSTNTGTAHDVTIDFLGLPMLWLPYISFPLNDERKSGFLSGAFSFDPVNGVEIEAPYYFNLAPNYDDILYPRIITKRGIQLGNAFELLTPVSYDYLYASYLPHDRLADHDRGQLIAEHKLELNPNLTMTGEYNWISDDNFFRDLSSDLAIISSTYLNRDLNLTYSDGLDLSAQATALDYQVIDPSIAPASYPFRELPSFTASWGNYDAVTGSEYQVGGQLVRFQRAGRPGAWRLDTKPSISLPLTGSAGFFTPSLAWRYDRYDLDEQRLSLAAGDPALAANPLLDSSSHPSLSVPIFSLGTGLYFDRDAGDYLQTLEPQLFYLRVPYRDQSQLPIFDTNQTPFSFLQLFSDNTFYGGDRQSDANQLSYALTSRIINPATGAEVVRGDIGQIRYFADRRVQLGPLCTAPSTPAGCTPAQTGLFSDIAGDLAYNLNDVWTVSYQQLWSPASRNTDLANVLFQYHPGYRQVVNLGYQYQSNNYYGSALKQTDFSFSWPLSGNWSVVGRWNRDIVNNVTLEDFVGVEYDSCCWNFQILHRHVVVGQNTYDNVFFFQLSLKGLVTAGKHLDDLVENGILGYSDSAFTQPQQSLPHY